jgi:MFS family permease
MVFLFSIFVNEWLRRIKNKRKMLRLAAILTHAPLLLLVFFPTEATQYTRSDLFIYLFLALFFIFHLNTIIVLPAINQMLKNNYSHKNFSRLYSYSSTVNKVVIMLTTLGFGFLLDFDNYSFVYIYPTVALLGILSVFLLSKIKYKDRAVIKRSFWQSTKNSLQSTFQILKSNKSYLHFEVGFMLYGFAWMVSSAVIPIYYNEVFEMNHATYGFYKNGYNLLAIILLPYFGSLLGRIDPRKFGIYTFGSLMLFMVFLGLAGVFPAYLQFGEIRVYYVLVVAYAFYGVFAATMALLWFIGSAYFCKKEEAAQYQSIHLTLTGVRSLFSFQIGVLLYMSLGYEFTFGLAAFSLLMAVLVMIWSYRRSQIPAL